MGSGIVVAWTLYRNWAHNVIRMRIRVLQVPNGSACYGPSVSAMTLRPGSIGTITNILPENPTLPSYVKFRGHKLDWTHAAEVLIQRADNTDLMWREFSNMLVEGDEAMVLITHRALMTSFEIEYGS